MAEISKLKLGSTTYLLKDNEAREAIKAIQTALASSLVFKGVISSATDITTLTDYKIGWTYKSSSNFSIPDLGKIENGDMIVCISDYLNDFKPSDWTVVQNNIDIMEGATAETSGTKGLVPAPTISDKDKFLCGDGTWQLLGLEWGKF